LLFQAFESTLCFHLSTGLGLLHFLLARDLRWFGFVSAILTSQTVLLQAADFRFLAAQVWAWECWWCEPALPIVCLAFVRACCFEICVFRVLFVAGDFIETAAGLCFVEVNWIQRVMRVYVYEGVCFWGIC
jgi:hypothetical protein